MVVQYAVAIIPVAIYLILIGVLRRRNRPLVTSGWRDTLTLGIASAGLIAVGPMQLFTPPQAVERWHAWVWVMLFCLYVLGLSLILLSGKPRLIAYGLNHLQFRDVLFQSAKLVDDQSHWSADVLSMPGSSMQLALEATGSSRVQQATHVGILQNLDDWIKLESEFVRMGGQTSCPSSIAGWPLMMIGSGLLLSSIIPLIRDPAAALAQLQNFIDR
jgi:hypothetical protein